MPKVLIVDDEEIYRDQLEMALAADGHVIKTVSSGRKAIDAGTRFRPDVIVTDWMLKNHIHGLHVVETLRACTPDVRSILITGFPSDDLREDAGKLHVVDFIEKPFKRNRIRSAVRDALEADPAPPDQWLPGVMEVDDHGAIGFANPKARELFAETEAGRDAASISDLFAPEETPDLDAAADRWITTRPRSELPTAWHLRAQAPRDDGTRLVVLRRQRDPQYLSRAIIEMLLESAEPRPVSWPFEGRVLVVDGDAVMRRLLVSTFETTGAGCYAAETSAEARRLLENDTGIKYVILDHALPDAGVADVIKTIQTIRPDVTIVGTSTFYRRGDFAAAGVHHFLQKPWRISDLINTLQGPVDDSTQ